MQRVDFLNAHFGEECAKDEGKKARRKDDARGSTPQRYAPNYAAAVRRITEPSQAATRQAPRETGISIRMVVVSALNGTASRRTCSRK